MKEQHFRTFDEFWLHYVRAHEKRATRNLHFVRTSAAMACLAGGLLLRKPLLLALAPLAGYGPAWLGHFFIEKNRPATLAHPLWSLQADLLMWSMTLAGTMDAEVERVTSSNGYHHEPAGADEAVQSALAAEQRARRARETMN
jgi:hypothetical protein